MILCPSRSIFMLLGHSMCIVMFLRHFCSIFMFLGHSMCIVSLYLPEYLYVSRSFLVYPYVFLSFPENRHVSWSFSVYRYVSLSLPGVSSCIFCRSKSIAMFLGHFTCIVMFRRLFWVSSRQCFVTITSDYVYLCIIYTTYTGCFTTLGHNCRK